MKKTLLILLFIVIIFLLFKNIYIFKQVDNIDFHKNNEYSINKFNSLKILKGINNDFYIIYSDLIASDELGKNETNIIFNTAFKKGVRNKYDERVFQKNNIILGSYLISFFPEIHKISDESIIDRIFFKNDNIYIFYPEYMSKNGDYGKLQELNNNDFLNNLNKNTPYITFDKNLLQR